MLAGKQNGVPPPARPAIKVPLTEAEFAAVMEALRLSPGLRLVIKERLRQVRGEGWTPGHDDSEHPFGELAIAGVCYADTAIAQAEELRKRGGVPTLPPCYIHRRWPWAAEWWKPRGVVRNLERAAALVIAELDRVLRLLDRLGAARATEEDDE